ncbi:MAG TPA: PucR family transcriptional regulator ligand-binding domain-containing protein [Streptosporangiaceae bacterium]|nr:PucR family transcriptional regulator ligand-binding domain-containing protein [Streptosporangiaceae bacterium]
MRVRDLLDVPGLGLRLLTDVSGVDRVIRHVYTTDLPDPTRYLTPGDLVLTGMIWCREPGDADRFVRALARAGAGVLGAGEALGEVKPEVIQACRQHGIALLAVPAETSFAVVTEEVGRRLNGDRATAMTRVLGRRRLLLSAVAEGAGLDAMFRLMGREIGAECWLLTATGRVVGGTGPSVPEPLALRLAGEYLKADRLPAMVRVSGPQIPAAGDRRYSLFAVGGEPRITSWFLACAGHEQDWAHELRESVAELAADAALERARLDAGRAGGRKLAEAIVTLLAADGGEGVAPAEIASLMRAAGMPPEGRYLVAAMTAEADRMTGPNAERWRCDLVEELAVPPVAAPETSAETGRAAGDGQGLVAAALDDQIVALIPLPADTGEASPAEGPDSQDAPRAGASRAAHAFAARLRDAQPVLEADRSRIRLTAGISAPAEGVAALAGALHEAQSARRLATIRAAAAPAPVPAVCVVTSDEVASHELLLASVPGSVLRSFRDRLLGPLLAYDERHRAELLPTLREFLACSGSWNACAARMYVHVNTVRYRIRRIEELTGRDLSCLDDQVDFFLALRIR